MTDILNELSALAAAIHYPECWDTAAYPDLLSALREVTASAGCSMCKSPVEQDPVGEGTDDRAIADTVNTLRDIAINFHAADQLRARIAHVVVPRLKRIQELETLNETRLGEIRTTLKLLAEARGERDALREQARGLSVVLGAAAEALQYLGGTLHAERCRTALAAVREPASQHVPGEQHRVETDTHTIVLGNPPEEPDDWPEDDSRRHNCDAMGCGRAHVLARIRKPPSTPAKDVCEHCDGTGDVHSADGEWRGACSCTASLPAGEGDSK